VFEVGTGVLFNVRNLTIAGAHVNTGCSACGSGGGLLNEGVR
jgi:hypothetical protein